MSVSTIGTFGTILLVAFAAVACGGPRAVGAQPGDMTHEEHLAAASAENETAEKHDAKYDPDKQAVDGAQSPSAGHSLWGDPASGSMTAYPGRIYNPTLSHKQLAIKHRDFAKQHEAAAGKLAEFEDQQCATVHRDARPYCSLLGMVEKVEEIANGVRLHIKGDVITDAVLDHSRCHLVYGAAHGYEGMPDCPLYVEGSSIAAGPGGSIDITNPDPDAVKLIRERAATHVED